MKRMRTLLCLLLIAALLVGVSGCYVVRGQKMSKLVGTYKLTNYTYTPQYERRNGYTREATDYINDERYLYEDYLIITGSGTGYYVHKAAGVPAYVKEVTLSYEYSQEDSSKIEYVTFKDVLTTTAEPGRNRVAVNGNLLNYAKTGIEMTIFGKTIRTEEISVRWEKVDDATDLSYVKNQMGSLKVYGYEAFGVRGVYEVTSSVDIETGAVLENQYQYCYYVVDTANGVGAVKMYYALKETPTTREVKNLQFSCSEDWGTFTIGNKQWIRDLNLGNDYYNETDGVRHQLTCVSSDISDARLEELIVSRMPVPTE